jgi:DNA adenine methylase
MTIFLKKPPFSYYGGKQLLAKHILPRIPVHKTYVEPFAGGAAIFWMKEPSKVEILNDTNREIINFYEVLKLDFESLYQKVQISLYSRDLHRKAWIIYSNPDMFNTVERAWAFWILAVQGFGGMITETWGHDKTNNKTVKTFNSKKENFNLDFAIRLQNVELECRDAVKLIQNLDYEDAFFYVDPPYYNADMGHYDGYTVEDFETLLKTLEQIKGKFMLSS